VVDDALARKAVPLRNPKYKGQEADEARASKRSVFPREEAGASGLEGRNKSNTGGRTATVQQSAHRDVVGSRGTGRTKMRAIGVDVGTGFISCAEEIDGEIKLKKVRDAFFRIDVSNFVDGVDEDYGKNMLREAGAHYMEVDGSLFVLGDDAFKFASMFHQECLRPLSRGVLNPTEEVAGLMVQEIIKAMAGAPSSKDDVIRFSVPAEPLDRSFDTVYHKKTLVRLFSSIGYVNVESITEAHAIVHAELASERRTGIGMSFGAGLTNVCYCFLGVPIFSFSIPYGGDWIDTMSARSVELTANDMAVTKEKGIKLREPDGREQSAIAFYYEELMDRVVSAFRNLYERTPRKSLPGVVEPMPVVVAGGTALAGGFVDCLRQRIDSGFPVPIKDVRIASKPLFAVSEGLLGLARHALEKG